MCGVAEPVTARGFREHFTAWADGRAKRLPGTLSCPVETKSRRTGADAECPRRLGGSQALPRDEQEQFAFGARQRTQRGTKLVASCLGIDPCVDRVPVHR